jgi:hypothetical protein
MEALLKRLERTCRLKQGDGGWEGEVNRYVDIAEFAALPALSDRSNSTA